MAVLLIVIFFLSITLSNWDDARYHQKPNIVAAAPDEKPAPPSPKTYTEQDFVWAADDDTSEDDVIHVRDKAAVVAGINRIVRENPNCPIVDPSDVFVDPDKGTKSNPAYQISCDDGKGNIGLLEFSRKDVESGASLAALPPMDARAVGEACEDYIDRHTSHPQLVDFSYSNLRFGFEPDGTGEARSTFSYTNGYGVKLTYQVFCNFDKQHRLASGEIWEADHQ